MWGLLLKDLYVNKKEIAIHAALAGVCSVFLLIPFGAETMEKLGLLYFLLGIMWLTGIFASLGALQNGLLAADENQGYQQLVLSSPLGYRGQVLSKYCACLLISLVGVFWCIFLTGISGMITGGGNRFMLPVAILFSLQLLLRALELPFLFGLGARYGNYVKLGVGLIVVFLLANHALYGDISGMSSFEEIMNKLSGFFGRQLPAGGRLALGLWEAGCFLLFCGSYHLSCLWYRRRVRQ